MSLSSPGSISIRKRGGAGGGEEGSLDLQNQRVLSQLTAPPLGRGSSLGVPTPSPPPALLRPCLTSASPPVTLDWGWGTLGSWLQEWNHWEDGLG